jgi:hypothetical protein
VSAEPLVAQPRLLDAPMCGLAPLALDDANRLLVAWGHRLGPVRRPFAQEAYALELDGRPISVAVSASTVGDAVAGTLVDRPVRYARQEVVELARLASDPGERWATRVMLRLWREVCAPRWHCWPVLAAVSYSHNALHAGDLYRFDGWTKIADGRGSMGGGSWSRRRYATEAVYGKKSLWLWRYDS